MANLGALPPGDIGQFKIDWTDQLEAVAGDSISGNLTVDCAAPDLHISNIVLQGSTLTFLASSDVEGAYVLVTRASFAPSGRRLSQYLELTIGLPPAAEPVTLNEARQHLRLDTSGNPPSHPDDDLVSTLIVAARQYVEGETGLSLVTTRFTDTRDSWDDDRNSPHHHGWGHGWGPLSPTIGELTLRPSFLLLHAPVVSIDEVRYLDTNGVLTVLPPDQYRAVPFAGVMTRLEPALGEVWPCAYYGVHGAVQVDYTTGFSGPVEEGLRVAIKLLIGAYYENRGMFDKDDAVPIAVSDILDGYRVL